MTYQDYKNGHIGTLNGSATARRPSLDVKLGSRHAREKFPMWTEEKYDHAMKTIAPKKRKKRS